MLSPVWPVLARPTYFIDGSSAAATCLGLPISSAMMGSSAGGVFAWLRRPSRWGLDRLAKRTYTGVLARRGRAGVRPVTG